MRNFLFLMFSTMALSSSVIAQHRDTNRILQDRPDTRPVRTLDLSKDQADKLKLINQQSKAKADSVKRDTTIDAGMRLELQKQLQANRRKLIMETLTPEQQKQYSDALKANRKVQREKKRIELIQDDPKTNR
ncbi:MAG: hypothetical protein EOO04_06205 [Chitinophagaceae bacterium]|nr:MAG: hypothetical protein EOO04_06205 [Chitinophagaceae bacterium]